MNKEKTKDEEVLEEHKKSKVPTLTPEDRVEMATEGIQKILEYYKCGVSVQTTIDSAAGVHHSWQVLPYPLGEES
jgi:hypothetical protein